MVPGVARGPRPWISGRGYAWLLPLPCGFLAMFFVWPLARVVLRSVLEPHPGFANYHKVLSWSHPSASWWPIRWRH
jgi:hypothetical protein